MASFQSVQLATIGDGGEAEASYAPAVADEKGRILIFVSELASHTDNLMRHPAASALIIEDESTCQSIFARKRLTLRCQVEEVPRHSHDWDSGIAALEQKHGKMMRYLKTLEDFHLFRLRPLAGRLVLGFGQAYDLSGADLSEVRQATSASGSGHRKESHRPEPEEEAAS